MSAYYEEAAREVLAMHRPYLDDFAYEHAAAFNSGVDAAVRDIVKKLSELSKDES